MNGSGIPKYAAFKSGIVLSRDGNVVTQFTGEGKGSISFTYNSVSHAKLAMNLAEKSGKLIHPESIQ